MMKKAFTFPDLILGKVFLRYGLSQIRLSNVGLSNTYYSLHQN